MRVAAPDKLLQHTPVQSSTPIDILETAFRGIPHYIGARSNICRLSINEFLAIKPQCSGLSNAKLIP
jgi:hypothetical protein